MAQKKARDSLGKRALFRALFHGLNATKSYPFGASSAAKILSRIASTEPEPIMPA